MVAADLVVCLLLQIGQNAWMSVWADATEAAGARGEKLRNTMYLIVYFSLGIGAMALTVCHSPLLPLVSLRLGSVIHQPGAQNCLAGHGPMLVRTRKGQHDLLCCNLTMQLAVLR